MTMLLDSQRRTERPLTEIKKIEPTPADVDWCARLTDYETVISMSEREAFEQDGYRFPCSVVICDDLKSIRIKMRQGSNQFDLNWAEGQVARIRDGHYREFPWQTAPLEFDRTKTAQWALIGFETAGLSKQEWGARGGGYKLIICDNVYCDGFGKIHSYADDDPEQVTHYAKDGHIGVDWSITIEKNGHAPWRLFVECGEDLTPEQSRAFANDLSWMAAETEKLNRAEAEVHA